ncbi:MAG TPA: hypothetical protein VJ914_35485 [Pseudonocardiaceae bacterium]|nr:hypothetical protein [Pseudonocardiaceae bacterium]
MAAGFGVAPSELDTAAQAVDQAMAAFPNADLMGLRTDGDAIGRAMLADAVSDFIYAWQVGIGYLLSDGSVASANLRLNAQWYRDVEQSLAGGFAGA